MLPVARQPDRLVAIALGPLDGVEPTGARVADTRPPTRFRRGPSPSRGQAGLDQFIGQAGGRKQPLGGGRIGHPSDPRPQLLEQQVGQPQGVAAEDEQLAFQPQSGLAVDRHERRDLLLDDPYRLGWAGEGERASSRPAASRSVGFPARARACRRCSVAPARPSTSQS